MAFQVLVTAVTQFCFIWEWNQSGFLCPCKVESFNKRLKGNFLGLCQMFGEKQWEMSPEVMSFWKAFSFLSDTRDVGFLQ